MKKSENEKKHEVVRAKEIENKKLNMMMQDKKFVIKKEQKGFVDSLAQKLNANLNEVKEQIKSNFVSEVQRHIHKEIELFESDIKEKQEELAKKILDTALDRFARAYCP